MVNSPLPDESSRSAASRFLFFKLTWPESIGFPSSTGCARKAIPFAFGAGRKQQVLRNSCSILVRDEVGADGFSNLFVVDLVVY